MFIFKENIYVLSKVIAHICNLSLKEGKFSSDLTTTKVICLPKPGDTSDSSNYRRITEEGGNPPPSSLEEDSLLPAFGKILEKVVENRLYKCE